MRLIITDLTEMHGGNYCVAGWDAQTERMVRPLPDGRNWTLALLQQHGIIPGASVDVAPTGQNHLSAFPHRTEDTIIDRQNVQLVNAGPINWFGAGAPPVQGTLAEIFENHIRHNSEWEGVRQGVYVQEGTQVRSLGAITVARNSVRLVEEFGKLKAIVDDGEAEYKLAISSLSLKDAWRQGGLQAVRQSLPQSAQFHVRVGLARGFGDPPDKCYMMVNGVHG